MFTIASNATSHRLLTKERRYTYCGNLKQRDAIVFTECSSTARDGVLYEDEILQNSLI